MGRLLRRNYNKRRQNQFSPRRDPKKPFTTEDTKEHGGKQNRKFERLSNGIMRARSCNGTLVSPTPFVSFVVNAFAFQFSLFGIFGDFGNPVLCAALCPLW